MWDFMKFLALMKINNDGIGNNDEENRKILTEKIIPGLKILESWEADGKLEGGLFHGQRSAALIVEAESLDELDGMMETLHLNGAFDADIIELQPISDALAKDEEVLKTLDSSDA